MYDNRFNFAEVTHGMGLNKRDVEALGSKTIGVDALVRLQERAKGGHEPGAQQDAP